MSTCHCCRCTASFWIRNFIESWWIYIHKSSEMKNCMRIFPGRWKCKFTFNCMHNSVPLTCGAQIAYHRTSTASGWLSAWTILHAQVICTLLMKERKKEKPKWLCAIGRQNSKKKSSMKKKKQKKNIYDDRLTFNNNNIMIMIMIFYCLISAYIVFRFVVVFVVTLSVALVLWLRDGRSSWHSHCLFRHLWTIVLDVLLLIGWWLVLQLVKTWEIKKEWFIQIFISI